MPEEKEKKEQEKEKEEITEWDSKRKLSLAEKLEKAVDKLLAAGEENKEPENKVPVPPEPKEDPEKEPEKEPKKKVKGFLDWLL